MQDRHIIAIYCRFTYGETENSNNDSQTFPEHVKKRLEKASEVFSRITASHPDSEHMRIIFFGEKSLEALKRYGVSIGFPEDKIELDSCKDIASMAIKVWNRVRKNATPPRVYFVVSNWQWIFLDSLTGVKDNLFKFYLEGAVDERQPEEIESDKMMEKVAKIDLKENKLAKLLDKVGSVLSENLKG